MGVLAVFSKSPIEPNAIYTRQETAHLLGISLSSLKELIRTGQLKVSQPLGMRRVLIRGSGILDMLDRSEKTLVEPTMTAADYAWQGTDPKSNTIRPKQGAARVHSGGTKRTAHASGGASR